ncbi:MAG: hypothetical protein HY290_02225, partial [Planctomycetia bacterium]|nr:hypothetical protein [Planctomycetia bacterium]
VPGYLVPKFNSHIKLSERGKKQPVAEETAKTAPKVKQPEADKPSFAAPVKVTPPVAEKQVAPAPTTETTAPAVTEKAAADAAANAPAAVGEKPQPAPVDANTSTKADVEPVKK